MTLRTLESAYPNYRHTFEGNDVKGLDLYTEGGERVGSVEDVLVDNDGRFRYLVIHPSAWMQGKSVLLPIGLSRIDYTARRVYADGFSRQQVEQLPEYQANVPIDRTYETRVRNVYREQPLEASTPLESSMPLEGAGEGRRTSETAATRRSVDTPKTTETMGTASSDAYPYDHDPDLYEVTDRNHQLLKQHQDQLRTTR